MRKDKTLTLFVDACLRLQHNINWQEVDGLLVCGAGSAKQVRKMLAKGMAPRDVERFWNHEHMRETFAGVFHEDISACSLGDLRVATETYAAMIGRHLKLSFPEKRFAVEIIEEEDDIILTHYTADQDGESKRE